VTNQQVQAVVRYFDNHAKQNTAARAKFRTANVKPGGTYSTYSTLEARNSV